MNDDSVVNDDSVENDDDLDEEFDDDLDEDFDDDVDEDNDEDTKEPPQRELRDFFGGVGAWATAERRSRPVKAVWAGRRWVAAAVAVAVVGLVVQALWWSGGASSLPSEMHGAWQTAEASHADRLFWIAQDSIAFQVGPTAGDVTRHPLKSLRTERTVGDTTWYDVVYEATGGEVIWSIIFTASSTPTIRLVTQGGMLWTPAPGIEWPEG